MKVKHSILALLIFFAAGTALAQKGKGHHQGAHNPEMRKAIKAYTQENVLPVMQTQRAKLDASLSRSEQKELEAIRTELA
ncbi:MAG: hypothetical protein AAFP02_26480, partial [Bacteroidota bacterium]